MQAEFGGTCETEWIRDQPRLRLVVLCLIGSFVASASKPRFGADFYTESVGASINNTVAIIGLGCGMWIMTGFVLCALGRLIGATQRRVAP